MPRQAVLITGGGGFIGSHLAETYLKRNFDVICVDSFITGLRSNRSYLEKAHHELQKTSGIQSDFYFIEANVIPEWHWIQKIPQAVQQKIQYVFHFASPASPMTFQDMGEETLWVNSLGLKNALNFADQVGARLIFASTSEVYGDPETTPQTEDYWGSVNSFGPRSCYDESKRFGEALIYQWNQNRKTKHGLVRIFNTYGPRMNPVDGRVVIQLLQQAMLGQNLTIFGTGEQTRSFCYINDLVEGIVRYAQSELVFPINLGSDSEIQILELADAVCRVCQCDTTNIEFLPLPEDDPKQRRPDLTRAKKFLNEWRPSVSLDEGLRQTYRWLQAHKAASMQDIEL